MGRLTQAIRTLFGAAPPPAASPARFALWSIGLFTGDSPLALGPDDRFPNPIITRDSITDVPASFVADPFLVRARDTWHLYFEIFNRRSGRGEIGLATSADLAQWEYKGVVLAEPFHLSYPQVFEWQGVYYMVPECQERNEIRLYRADCFPDEWTQIDTILDGAPFCDTTLFRHDERWWLFTHTNKGKHDDLRLFLADDLFGTWTEHPASPIVEHDPHTARPGGRVVSHGGVLLRFAQDCAPQYGLRVMAFEITKLTPTEYAERPATPNVVLEGSGSGWNASRMHHVDAHNIAPGSWIAAVDGARNTTMADINGTT